MQTPQTIFVGVQEVREQRGGMSPRCKLTEYNRLVSNNFALIQFYPYTLAGSLQGALPGPMNPVAFEIHVVDEQVGLEDEEEKMTSTIAADLKTSLRQSCNNPRAAQKGFRGSHGNSSTGGGSDNANAENIQRAG